MNTLQSIVYTVRDLEGAKALHTALLAVEPHTDQPYYVGFNVGGLEIGLTPDHAGTGATGPIAYVGVADLDAAVAAAVGAGATLADGPKDVGGGTQLATLTDADGTVVGLIHHD
jgi:predicted enzyme related to lactoylglutathione lyase